MKELTIRLHSASTGQAENTEGHRDKITFRSFPPEKYTLLRFGKFANIITEFHHPAIDGDEVRSSSRNCI